MKMPKIKNLGLSTGGIFIHLIVPKIEKGVKRKISVVCLFYDKITEQTIVQIKDEKGEDIANAGKETSFEKLTEGAMGQFLLKKINKQFPDWTSIGAILNKTEKKVDLVFYNKDGQKIGSQTL